MTQAAEPTERKLLILDLDETLVHARKEPLPGLVPDFSFVTYFVYERPHVQAFLDYALASFRVAVWTSSSPDYAALVVSQVFAERRYELEFVWARDRCTIRYDAESQQRYWRKHLRKLKRHGYSLAQTIMVDDTPAKLEQNYGNLVCVPEFTGDPDDDVLLRLPAFLDTLQPLADVRPPEKRGWHRPHRPSSPA